MLLNLLIVLMQAASALPLEVVGSVGPLADVYNRRAGGASVRLQMGFGRHISAGIDLGATRATGYLVGGHLLTRHQVLLDLLVPTSASGSSFYLGPRVGVYSSVLFRGSEVLYPADAFMSAFVGYRWMFRPPFLLQIAAGALVTEQERDLTPALELRIGVRLKASHKAAARPDELEELVDEGEDSP